MLENALLQQKFLHFKALDLICLPQKHLFKGFSIERKFKLRPIFAIFFGYIAASLPHD
jgi:hypothetical protein